MRISFGGKYVPYGTDEEPEEPPVPEGESQVFTFGPGEYSLDDNQLVIAPCVVESFGDGIIGRIRLSVYVTMPNIHDLSMQLLHPAYEAPEYGSGFFSYNVYSTLFERDPGLIDDLGESSSSPVRFVWDVDVPSITEYSQDGFGDFCPIDDGVNVSPSEISVLPGMFMAGTWRLWVYDYNGHRDEVQIEFAQLEIFDGNSVFPSDVDAPNMDFTLEESGLVLDIDASATTGGVSPLRYSWTVYKNTGEFVGVISNGGFASHGYPNPTPNASLTLPETGIYVVVMRVLSESNYPKVYTMKKTITITD